MCVCIYIYIYISCTTVFLLELPETSIESLGRS